MSAPASFHPASPQTDAERYRRLFLPLWVAMVALQSGLLVHDVAAGWLLASSGASHSLVALAQTAASLPFFFCALPAGALADLVERRRVLQGTAFVLSAASLLVAAAAAFGQASPALLLAASFLNGCANATFSPTWQATTPELVDTQRLPGALALNSLGINVARSIGPLLSGLILYVAGAPYAFLFNFVLYGAVGLTFLALAPRHAVTVRETLAQAVRGGLVYAAYDWPLQKVALRASAFFLFACTFWALAPVVVHDWFSGTGLSLGLLVGAAGIGAICAALSLKALRARADLDGLMLGAGLLAAAALAAVPFAPALPVLAVLYAGLGFAWLISFSSIHLAAQLRLATWIRARGSAVYLSAIFGSIAIGSFFAGLVSDWIGISGTYWAAAAILTLSTLVGRRLRIVVTKPVVLARSVSLPAPPKGGGSVEVVISYIPATPQAGADLERRLLAMKPIRRRCGALGWSCVATGGRVEERLLYASPAALDLAAGRQTEADTAIEQALLSDLAAAPAASVTLRA